MNDAHRGLPHVDRARGLLLGLLLGDARVFEPPAPGQRLVGSAAGQLACFTVEGLIRAHVRGSHRGIWSPRWMVWMALQRWGHAHGLPVVAPEHQQEHPWPDGWASQQVPLRTHRGSAPATAAALQGGRMGTLEQPVGGSAGHHALSNAAVTALLDVDEPAQLAAEVAALTHGAPAAQHAAAAAAVLLSEALRGDTVPRQPEPPAAGPSGTAQAALHHGWAAVQAYPDPAELLDALSAAHRSGGRGAATFAGALLGAVHGAPALPQPLLGRLELGLVGDTLARDIIVQQEQSPSGSEYSPNPDLSWWHRYPGY